MFEDKKEQRYVQKKQDERDLGAHGEKKFWAGSVPLARIGAALPIARTLFAQHRMGIHYEWSVLISVRIVQVGDDFHVAWASRP